MNSLSTRLLIAASIVLIFFLGLTGLTVDRAFRQSAQAMEFARLQSYTYDLLRHAEESEEGASLYVSKLPSRRLLKPNSGLYASVVLAKTNQIVWQSPSMKALSIPFMRWVGVGKKWFGEIVDSDGNTLFSMSYGVLWVDESGQEQTYIFSVAENQSTYQKEVEEFRHGLWLWFAGIVLVLLVVQGLILRWGLLPLRRVSQDLQAIEQGKQTQLTGHYPDELRGLTDNLNALLFHERHRQARYRNALGDLAHSVKTPLAVLNSALESATTEEELRLVLLEQVERLNQITSYQLQRAAASGQISLMTRVTVLQVANKIVSALTKVYATKGVQCTLHIDSQTVFFGEEGDLLELLGNLLDNAYKWCHRFVTLTAVSVEGSSPGLQLVIEDDGPGFPENQIARVLQRGERADSSIDGHGIGLAVVDDIVKLYHGKLSLGKAKEGGARIEIYLARTSNNRESGHE